MSSCLEKRESRHNTGCYTNQKLDIIRSPKKSNETAQDWLVKNLRVESSSHGLFFEDLTTRASKKTKDRETTDHV